MAKLARIFLPSMLLIIWVVGAAIGGPYFGRISEVAENDQAAYLPSSAEATQVDQRFLDFAGATEVPAIVVFTSETTLDDGQYADLQQVATDLTAIDGVVTSSPLLPSEDQQAAQIFLGVDPDAELAPVVDEIRQTLSDETAEGITTHVTGPAGLAADLGGAFAGIDGLLLIVALAVVLVILLIVYRAIALPFIVLFNSVSALTVALFVNWWLAKWGILTLSGQTQGILFILVIGAATDYALLYTARYAEELKRHEYRLDATKATMKGVLEPILASGGTVIAGLMTLVLSDLESNGSLGPVASIGILFAILSAFTLLPAMLYLFGRVAYWPRKPTYDAFRPADYAISHGIWSRISQFVSRWPRAIWIVSALALAAGAAFFPTLRANGVDTTEFVLGTSDARDGEAALSVHFPGGSGQPARVLTDEGNMDDVVDTILGIDGVASVAVISADSPAGSAPITADGIQAFGPPGTPAPQPTVSEGQVMLLATLDDSPHSDAALDTVREMRAELSGVAEIGGTTAVDIDTRTAAQHDRNVIIPVGLAVIFVILMLLLRSIVAPLLLIATTALSFATAMGTAAILFNHVLKLPGADASVPLYGFVFLVALGIDYNIFLMTRVREESLKYGTRQGILRGLAVTGGVITSAGLVLAATFAALVVIPVLFLVQLAFIVAFGVLLDTFIVRTILVPALAYDIGPAVWWPKRLQSDKDLAEGEESAKEPAPAV